jgi:hypothetical protein
MKGDLNKASVYVELKANALSPKDKAQLGLDASHMKPQEGKVAFTIAVGEKGVELKQVNLRSTGDPVRKLLDVYSKIVQGQCSQTL